MPTSADYRRCGTCCTGSWPSDRSSLLCAGSDADGQLELTFDQVSRRCTADRHCAGFSNMSQSSFRPYYSISKLDSADTKWQTWHKSGFIPTPPPPPKPAPPPPPTPRSWQVWKKRLSDGSVAAAFLNRGSQNQTITVHLSMLGIAGEATARDLWLRQDLAKDRTTGGKFTAMLPAYGSKAIKFTLDTPQIVCDEVPAFHSPRVRTHPHFLRTYARLDCADGMHIAEVRFASLGQPQGVCGGERRATPRCHLEQSKLLVERACLGQHTCQVETRGLRLPAGPACEGSDMWLAVEALCQSSSEPL